MSSVRLVTILSVAVACLAEVGRAANFPPTANPDNFVVHEDTRLSVPRPGVLTNDTDPESSTLTALLVTAPANGTLFFTNNGGFAYTPNTNFFGTDTFTYRARDGQSNSTPATVTITVNAVNDAPRATNNSYSLNADAMLLVNAPGVLGNDFDVEGGPLTTVLVSNATKGVLVLNGDGSFAYTPQANFSGTDSFTYRASDGVSNSGNATVTLNVVPAPIVVSSPPVSQAVCEGATVSFTVSATGTALRYQWMKGSTNLAGETNNLLLLPNVLAGASGTYRVRLTGATNSVTNSVTLTVNTPLSVPALPDLVRMVGSIAIFNAAATGSGPIAYTWLRDGEVLPGQNGSSLLLSNLVTGDSGLYSVIVDGACGSVTNTGRLTVAPCFNSFDVMLVLDRSGSMVGQAYTDARTAASNFVHNLHLSAETNDTLGLVSYNPTATVNQTLTNSPEVMEQAIQSLGPATNGTCISCGILAAQAELASPRRRPDALPVMVLLTDGIPHDFDTPSNALFNALQAKYAGTRIFTVAFGTNVDSAMMTGMASSPADYFYASNSSQLGALFDAISTVICRAPTNILGPYDLTVCAGAEVNLNVNASGCAAFDYQWRKDGVPLPGQTNNTLALGAAAVADAAVYSVVVSSECRTVTNSATLTVNAPAGVVVPQAAHFSYLGSNALLSVQATGTHLTQEWFFNGQLMGTGSSLSLENLTAAQAGTYCVVVASADCGGPVTNCLTLALINRPPIGTADSYLTTEDASLNVPAGGVLANDADPDADAVSAVLVTDVSHGTLALQPGGAFAYTPSLNYTGADTFAYRVFDGALSSEPVIVTIQVSPLNDPPVATGESYVTAEDTPLNISGSGVLGNDFDVDGDPLSVLLVSNAIHGVLVLQGNGSFAYSPGPNFHGEDSFWYQASDGAALSAPVRVLISVISSNDVPVAGNDAYSTPEDTAFTAALPGVLGNDSDADGDALAATLVSNVAHGTLVLGVNGAFTYTPSLNYTGVDLFTYVATDGVATSAVATVTITVAPVNDAPVALDDAYTLQEDAVLNISAAGVLANDADVDGDTLTVSVVAGVAHGILALNPNGAFTYTPSLNYTGVDTFTYVATDGLATSTVAQVTLTVLPLNDGPVVVNDSYTTAEDTTLSVPVPGVLVNDGDVDGDGLTVTLVDNVAHGSLTLLSNGAFSYTPSLNHTGVDLFTYRATDGVATSALATVTILVTPLNDAPVGLPDEFTTPEDTLLTIPVAAGVLTNDHDVDGDAVSALLISDVSHGVLSLNADGSFSYQPATNFHGEDSFSYRVSDGALHSGPVTVRLIVVPVNDPPVARDDAYATLEDTSVTVPASGTLVNDTDLDGDPVTALLVANVAHGSLSFGSDGAFVYTPAPNYHGTDAFTYAVTDGSVTSAVATVSIVVTPVNDRPLAGEADIYATLEDAPLAVAAPGVLGNDLDVDNVTLTAVLVSGVSHGTLVLQANGSFEYTPLANYFGDDSFVYVATDGQTNSAPATVQITVHPVNDAPAFSGGANPRVNFNVGPQTITGWATGLAAGPANEVAQAMQFEIVNDNPSLFSVAPAISSDGVLTFTPVGTVFGVAHLQVTLRDNGGTANGGVDASAPHALTITLNGPPQVSILTPTNHATFVGTNTITVVAEALDPDSAITNLMIYSGTNMVTRAALLSAFASIQDAPPGTYTFSAVVVDDLGLTATSGVVSVTVTQSPPVTALGPFVLNLQNGLFEQFVRISNPTLQSFPNGMRLLVTQLDPTNRVYNATGTNQGRPYIDVLQPLPSGGHLDVLVQYYVPNPRSVPNPMLIAEPLPFTVPVAPAPLLTCITKEAGDFVVQFPAAAGRLYQIQASVDCQNWVTLPGLLQGSGGVLARTNSLSGGHRFFRVMLLP